MVLLLNIRRFCLRAFIWLLPAPAFALPWLAGLEPIEAPTPARLGGLLALALAAWLAAVRLYGLDGDRDVVGQRTGVGTALAAIVTGGALQWLGLRLFGVAVRPGYLLASAVGLLLLTIAVGRVFRGCARRRLGGRHPLRVLVAGTDEFAAAAARNLGEAPFGGCQIAAWLHLPGEPIVIDPGEAPILELRDLETFDAGRIDDVVIALGPDLFHCVQLVAEACDPLCRPVRAIVELDGGPATNAIFQYGRLQMIDLGDTPAESPRYAIFKRIFDLGFALGVLAVAAPLMLAIAAAIKLTSKGPVLFRQSRVGLKGRTFQMLKFRTMQVASAAESDTRWTTMADPRRTWLGAWLRRSSLDELPQFINVLRGKMSVVGPRPERPHFVRRFCQDITDYHRRHRLQVGITGWAQVHGLRGDTSIRRRVEYDLDYLKRWSLGFDLRIIGRTVWSGLFGTNAY